MQPPPFALSASFDPAELDYLHDRLYVARTLVPPGYEPYLVRRARYRSVHTSTAIEGNRLAEREALRVAVEGPADGSHDAVEVSDLQAAYEFVQQVAEDTTVRIDEGLIRAMNSVLLKNSPSAEARQRGRYRPGISLVVDSATREIQYRPPPAEAVPALMHQYVDRVQRWIDEGAYPGPIIAALAHYGLVSIHPFADGNGRSARLLADMILLRSGWAAHGMLSVSSAILASQQAYYDALREAQGESFTSAGDATPFVTFHTQMLAEAADALEQSAITLSRRIEAFASRVTGTLNERQALAAMFMADVAPLSTTTYADLTGTSLTSARNDLNAMVAMGAAVRTGSGPSTRYQVAPELQQLATDPTPP